MKDIQKPKKTIDQSHFKRLQESLAAWRKFSKPGVVQNFCTVLYISLLVILYVIYLFADTLLDDFLLTYPVFMSTSDLCQALLGQYPLKVVFF